MIIQRLDLSLDATVTHNQFSILLFKYCSSSLIKNKYLKLLNQNHLSLDSTLFVSICLISTVHRSTFLSSIIFFRLLGFDFPLVGSFSFDVFNTYRIDILSIRYLSHCYLSITDSSCTPSILTNRWKSKSTDTSSSDHGSSNRLVEISTSCARVASSSVRDPY